MEREIINGFKWVSILGQKMLAIESDRLQEYLDHASSKNIKAIYLSNYEGYRLTHLDFFRQYDFFTDVTIHVEACDVSPIHSLRNLKKLNISNEKQVIDLTQFSHLEECSIDWNNKIIGLDTVNPIKYLKLWKFRPSSGDFTVLAGCQQTEILEITESNIESFKGINALTSLIQFEAYYLSRLEYLDGLETGVPQLSTLILEYSRKLKGYDTVLGQLSHLEKLILGDCGPLTSINFVHNLPRLSFFSFVGTNILDGDISPAERLTYVGFNNKRHYNRKSQEMKNTLKYQ
ncbi:leucine-rich repeat domain-containing protein [Chitinophaga arvensicola]|uniref:Leucine-rich repeat domain-containing protein n=1 Tax=Chitinophaga arvensicola TaxID=29529 RepID=A0A1I0SA51_9BACT|nr:hypothetical protein [Chitinophaga arvensicola]SEW53184.1 hypothetical protein SAMN04488122_5365 [Chitinophaga arvensicola]